MKSKLTLTAALVLLIVGLGLGQAGPPQVYNVWYSVEGEEASGVISVLPPTDGGRTEFTVKNEEPSFVRYAYYPHEDINLQLTAEASEGHSFQRWELARLSPDGAGGYDVEWEETHTDPETTLHLAKAYGNPSWWRVRAYFEEILEHTLTMAVEGQGTTTPEVGPHTYDEGDGVSITATPANGWEFSHWTVSDGADVEDPDSATTTVIVDEDKTVTAHFTKEVVDPKKHTLTVDSTAGGEVTQPGENTFTYDSGTKVGLKAKADVGYQFSKWTGDVDTIEDVNAADTVIAMDGDYSITAEFSEAPADTEIVKFTRSPGVGKAPLEVEFSFEAIAGTNREIVGWWIYFGDGGRTGTDALEPPEDTLKDTVKHVYDAPGEYTAELTVTDTEQEYSRAVTVKVTEEEPDMYTLEVDKEGEGTVRVDGVHYSLPYDSQYADSTEVELQAMPADGWEFDHWKVNDNTVADDNGSITVLMDEDKEAVAHFTQRKHTLTVDSEGEGTVEVDGQKVTTPYGREYAETSKVELNAIPADGWRLDRWELNGDAVEDDDGTVSVDIHNDTDAIAHFTRLPYTLTLDSQAGGEVVQPGEGRFPYDAGSTVVIKAVPDQGYRFNRWTGSVEKIEDVTAAETTITMDDDYGVVATFCWVDDNADGNWTEPTGLWHPTNRKSHSEEQSWWFGNPKTGTYGPGEYTASTASPTTTRDSGSSASPLSSLGRVQGTLESKEIPVEGHATVTFSFWHYRHVEYFSGGSYDRTWVEVGFDGEWDTLWSEDSRDPSQKAWEQVEFSLRVPDGASNMQIRFRFDSVDGLHNNYPGWFVDDIRVCLDAPPDDLRITSSCADLPRGVKDQQYEVQVTATGGQPPYEWSWEGRAPGLEFDVDGRITGVPTEVGEFDVTFVVEDARGATDQRRCTITVGELPEYLFYENFSDPADWSGDGLWHVREDDVCFDCEHVTAPFAYYAREGRCDFDTGARTRGELVSPEIDLHGATHVVLSFDFYRHVEYYADGAMDRTMVQVSLGDGGWQTVWARSSKHSSPECGSVEKTFATGGANSLRIRFVFDSVDRFFNDFRGWAVDNVAVEAAQGGTALSSIQLPEAAPRDAFVALNAPNPVTQGVTTFSVRGLNAERISVTVFDSSGRRVWADDAAGSDISWHTEDTGGRQVASGVYLYTVRVLVEGEWVSSGEIHKLLIVR